MEPTYHRVNAYVFTLICYPCVYEPQVKLFSLISRETQTNSCLSPSLETNREPKHVCQCVENSLGGGEQVAAVGRDAVDGALVTLELPQCP